MSSYDSNYLFDDSSSGQEMDDAIDRYRKALKTNSNSSSLPSMDMVEKLTMYCVDNENYEDALLFSGLWIDYYPFSSDAWQKKGLILINLNRHREAIQYIHKALSLNSSDIDALINLSMIFERDADYKSALHYIDKALDIDSKNYDTIFQKAMIYQSSNQYAESIKLLLYLDQISDDETEVDQEIAYNFNALQDFDNSIKYYLKAIDKNPYDENLWYNCGIIYNYLGKSQKAIDHFDMATVIEDDFLLAWFNLGNLYSLDGDIQKSIDSYHEALRIDPEFIDAITNLASAHGDIGEFHKAIKLYTRVLRNEPENYSALFGRGICFDALEEYNKALLDYDSALKLNSMASELWYAKGDAYYNKNEFEKSIRCYEKVLEIDPDEVDCLLDYGSTLYELNDFDRSEDFLKRLLELLPTNKDADYILAKIYAYRNDIKNSAKHLFNAFVLDGKKRDEFQKDFAEICNNYDEIYRLVKQIESESLNKKS